MSGILTSVRVCTKQNFAVCGDIGAPAARPQDCTIKLEEATGKNRVGCLRAPTAFYKSMTNAGLAAGYDV